MTKGKKNLIELADERPIPAENSILAYMHCRHCVGSVPKGESPKTWARLSVGWTELGLQVWCNRHEVNILHIDFEGMQHPAEQGGKPIDKDSPLHPDNRGFDGPTGAE